MEAFNLVLQSIAYPFSWLAQIWTADDFLWGSLMGLFCASLIVRLYLRPFLSGAAGSDTAGKKPKNKPVGGDET